MRTMRLSTPPVEMTSGWLNLVYAPRMAIRVPGGSMRQRKWGVMMLVDWPVRMMAGPWADMPVRSWSRW